MTVLGYVRVSTSKQITDQQRDALEAFGCARIFEDIASGARDRKGITALLDYARSGDTLVVWRLDRLGRSLSRVVRVAEDLHKCGVLIRGLNDGVDTATGRMLGAILAALAEYERT
jgi:DNA invertase Pin-like site-specific DNA recombinase